MTLTKKLCKPVRNEENVDTNKPPDLSGMEATLKQQDIEAPFLCLAMLGHGHEPLILNFLSGTFDVSSHANHTIARSARSIIPPSRGVLHTSMVSFSGGPREWWVWVEPTMTEPTDNLAIPGDLKNATHRFVFVILQLRREVGVDSRLSP